MLRRIGMAATVAVSALSVLVIPAQRAGAWPEEICKSYPQTPYMYDAKLNQIEGDNVAQCQNPVMLLVVRAELQKWYQTTQEFRPMGDDETQYKDRDSGRAMAFTFCAGQGTGIWRTHGESNGIYGYAGSSQHQADTGWRELTCGGGIPLIRP